MESLVFFFLREKSVNGREGMERLWATYLKIPGSSRVHMFVLRRSLGTRLGFEVSQTSFYECIGHKQVANIISEITRTARLRELYVH